MAKYLLNKKNIFLLLLIYGISLFVLKAPVLAADTTPPVSTLTTDPSSPNGENDWYTVYPTVRIEADDAESGVRTIYWKINDGEWQSTDFTEGLNLIQNPSFEEGYISHWNGECAFFAVCYKSSFFNRTGNYSASIVSLNGSSVSFWENDPYLQAIPLETYQYSFYVDSITSWLDNGFFQIVSVANDGTETVIEHVENIDLKLNYIKISGSFITTSDPDSLLYLRIGIDGMGHLSIDDVYVSLAGENTSAEFVLDQEGENIVYYYSEDAAGNEEDIKQQTIKIDTSPPSYSNFETFDEENVHTFASRVDVDDSVSGLVSDPALFNYSVDGFTDGYFENYGSCEGEFFEDEYLVINTDFSTGASDGTVSTPQIDYCDADWINCKRLNFYVKDLAGNIGDHSICVNGPYIHTTFGDVFSRFDIWNMGLGDEDNIWGAAVAGSNISDVSITSGISVSGYEHPYLNNLYTSYWELLGSQANTITTISENQGVYLIEDDYTIIDPIDYNDVNQVVFVEGDLFINNDITTTNSVVTYFVNGDIVIDNSALNVDSILVSTNEIFTSSNFELAEKVTIKGALISQNINFSRNTDRTLGASEVINFPVEAFFDSEYLQKNRLYWREITN